MANDDKKKISAKDRASTTSKSTNLDKSNTNEEETAQATSKSTVNISETVAETNSNTSSQDTENDRKRTQFFLAEAESAPKHFLSYALQEKFSKFLGAHSVQNSALFPKYPDGPSCSKLVTTVNVKPELQAHPLKESNEKPVIRPPKQTETNVTKIRSPRSIFKKDPGVDGELIYGTFRSIDTEIAVESNNADPTPASSVRSIGSLVCRICHNSENPERLVSPCLCKGTLSFVHIHCLERWISTSRSTICELCQFQYNTEQTLRYTCIQSLRMWYSRSMSRRALQEDCQMFSLLTLVAFGIIGTLLVGIQYYFIQGRHWGLSSMWTKGWLLFFLFTTLLVYFINIYMILRSQLAPWYRWWQSARDIKLILENRKPFKILPGRRIQRTSRHSAPVAEQQPAPEILDGPQAQPPMAVVHPIPPPMPLPPPTSVTSPSLVQTVNKLQISSELARTAAEVIEIPFEAFDSCPFDSMVTTV